MFRLIIFVRLFEEFVGILKNIICITIFTKLCLIIMISYDLEEKKSSSIITKKTIKTIYFHKYDEF